MAFEDPRVHGVIPVLRFDLVADAAFRLADIGASLATGARKFHIGADFLCLCQTDPRAETDDNTAQRRQ